MGIVFLTTLIFWGMLAGVIVLDIQGLAEKAVRNNADALYDLPDPGIWAALIIILGPLTTPIYFYKTRGAAKAVFFTLLVAASFAVFLKITYMIIGPLL